jgi:hypothetical protein
MNEYGLMIDRTNSSGTDYVEVHVVRREPGRDMPLGCSSDGESFYGEGTPKHLIDLCLDGLGMYGFACDSTESSFIGNDVEYRNVYSMSERKLQRMLKAIKRVNARIQKDEAREPGDKFMALANALKLSFAVHRIGPRRSNPEWRWMTITEGRNYYRSQIEAAITETNNRKKGVA